MSFIWLIVMVVWSICAYPWNIPLVVWLLFIPFVLQDIWNDDVLQHRILNRR